jgi:uncharacterized membrane protein SpoIIM required for sporulation
MDSLMRLLNLMVVVLFIGGWLLVLIAVWRSMKALESISDTVKKIHEKSSHPSDQEH